MTFPVQPSPPPDKPPLTGGGMALVFIGLLLLVFPGGCSTIFMIGAAYDELRGRHGGELNLNGVVFFISGVGLLVALLGFFMIRSGLRHRVGPPRR